MCGSVYRCVGACVCVVVLARVCMFVWVCGCLCEGACVVHVCVYVSVCWRVCVRVWVFV